MASYVHLLDFYKGRVAFTVCGMRGTSVAITNRYNGATCGKCRSLFRGKK